MKELKNPADFIVKLFSNSVDKEEKMTTLYDLSTDIRFNQGLIQVWSRVKEKLSSHNKSTPKRMVVYDFMLHQKKGKAKENRKPNSKQLSV